MNSMSKALLSLMFLSSIFYTGSSAQDISGEKETQTAVQDSVDEVPEVKDEAIKLFLDKIEVIGQLEKPQAIYIIPGSNPEIDDIKINRSFFETIFRPVEKKGRTGVTDKIEPVKRRKDYIPW
jgi:hypothetical protein